MSEKLGNIGISAFQPMPQDMIQAPPSVMQSSGFLDPISLTGRGNKNRQSFNLGYNFGNGASVGSAFNTQAGRNTKLASLYANLPLNEKIALSAGYQPVAGKMGQEQIAGKLKYKF